MMKHRNLVLAAAAVAACTYNEYNTYNSVAAPDAGVDPVSAAGGSSGQSVAGAGGSDTSQAGTGGSGGSAGAGEGAGCSGCVRLSVLTGRTADYQRVYSPRVDLSDALVTFRVRVRDYVGPVNVVMYVASDDHFADGGFTPETSVASSTLQADAGWQDVGIDLEGVAAFREPEFIDAGGAAGSGFDPGQPVDKSRVEAIGLRVSPIDSSGVLTPAILEIDALEVSSPPGLSLSFSADAADFELVDEDTATVTHVP
jgi:hypothetical protein